MDNLLALGNLHEIFMRIVITIGLCSIRILVVFFIIPVTNDQVLQGIVRNGIVMLLSTFVAYGQPISIEHLSALTLCLIAGKEALLGTILGFAASTVFWVAEGVGVFIDDLTGFNNIQVSNPMRSDISTPTAALLGQFAVTAFWALGGMMFLLGALYQSFQWWPLMSIEPVPRQILESFVLRQTDTLMQMIAKIATPMVLILVLIDLAFGFLSKGAERLETISLSMPVKGAMTILLLALFIGAFVEQVKQQLSLQEIAVQFQGMIPQIKPGSSNHP